MRYAVYVMAIMIAVTSLVASRATIRDLTTQLRTQREIVDKLLDLSDTRVTHVGSVRNI